MARPKSRFVCQSCAESFLRWEGQCPACGQWNSLVETVVRDPSRTDRHGSHAAHSPSSAAVGLAAIADGDAPRIRSGVAEFDRVLGGGLVLGSVVLVGGEPGIGKSTLLLQAAASLTHSPDGDVRVLYATGEESPGQVRLRAARLDLLAGSSGDGVRVLAEHDVNRIADVARNERPGLVIVDSIQTATVAELDGAAGSVGQVREATLRLMDLAKGDGIAVILVGHVTKDGTIAGPKTLEHLVDAVISLEGERFAALRVLRATKNRFGSTDEVGVFEMVETGLREVADPARAFLTDARESAPGSVISPTLEGSRPLLVEVQALVSPTSYGNPSRRASGLDPNRLNLLIAVLGRRAGIALGSHDVYANLAGGLSVAEPAIDLPLALALASSARDRPVPSSTIAIGEVGLLGELRSVVGLERRLREAARLGFDVAIIPASVGDALGPIEGLALKKAGTIREAIEIALPDRSLPRGDGVPAMLG
ncbi:MAG: DNA repair protein RadA [Thermomicrobiales bacterium]|nr:MAG: DNA repair protein RadA [Thermomicrobiales bacterium]